MNSVCLIDTSVFLNLLNVPNRNQEKTKVVEDYTEYSNNGCIFILPMATILETGNHIAQNGDGNIRRKTAKRFCEVVLGAFEGVAPYKPMEFPSIKDIAIWLNAFPDEAGKNKSPTKLGEGTSFGDLSIIKDFEKCRTKFSMSEIFIWSLDEDLKIFHHTP